MSKSSLLLVCALCIVTAAGADEIPGQKLLVVIGDKFQYIAGSWASYQILEIENNDIKMWIEDFGMDARTRISGTPRAFSLWILEQMAKETGKTP